MNSGGPGEGLPGLAWKTGFEIELLAPRGLSRRDLAEEIAARAGGFVRRCFHPQAELSEVPDAPIFENLTLGFEAFGPDGGLIARCADDLTLQDDLDRSVPSKPGWYRIAGDDARLLRLIMRHADPSEPLERVLDPCADLFGTAPVVLPEGMVRLADTFDAPIAIAAPLPGERERPCEIITPPIESGHFGRLEAVLRPARDLGFSVPSEAALHVHFDAGPLCSAAALANLVRVFGRHGEALKRLVGTNPRCRRLGGWPEELHGLVAEPGFAGLSWEEVKARMAGVDLTKYCDFNILNLLHPPPGKHTFEVRILPVWLEAEPIVRAARHFENLLRWCCETGSHSADVPSDVAVLLETPEAAGSPASHA